MIFNLTEVVCLTSGISNHFYYFCALLGHPLNQKQQQNP